MCGNAKHANEDPLSTSYLIFDWFCEAAGPTSGTSDWKLEAVPKGINKYLIRHVGIEAPYKQEGGRARRELW
jgi:hypothetical protein